MKDSIFEETQTIVIIGCSSSEYRTSNFAMRFLIEKGYNVIPVNPKYDTIRNVTCYDSINSIPEEIQIDMVNIFRKKEFTESVIEEVITRNEITGQKPVIWTQLDVSTPEAKEKALSNGFDYIENKCIMVEYDRVGVT